jgi:hypothetical protein
MSTISSGSKSRARAQRESKWQTESVISFHVRFLLGLIFGPEDGGDMLLTNVGRLSTDYTHGVISQKIELFMSTAVRTSSPESLFLGLNIIVLRNLKRYSSLS